MPYIYEHPHPSVTVDIVVFARPVGEQPLRVLLIERKHEPFKGAWALPGGFVDENEALLQAAQRELREETGLEGLALTQVGAYGDPGRDPRGHTVSVAYVAVMDEGRRAPVAGDDAARVQLAAWAELDLPESGHTGPVKLAFDHARIVLDARAKASI
jgi:8-oxo-dGTP diphosphatase